MAAQPRGNLEISRLNGQWKISAMQDGLDSKHFPTSQLNQLVSFEVELGQKGKRAWNMQILPSRRRPKLPDRKTAAQWGTATLFAIPAFLIFYTVVAILWKPPLWIAAVYLVASALTFLAYAWDKAAASRGGWRTQESSLHLLSIAGGWPGALVAQQLLRHKSLKQEFRQMFWATVVLNILAFLGLVSPFARSVLGAL